jgi:hypothetical protein
MRLRVRERQNAKDVEGVREREEIGKNRLMMFQHIDLIEFLGGV